MSSTPIIINTPKSEALNFKQREEENLKDAATNVFSMEDIDK